MTDTTIPDTTITDFMAGLSERLDRIEGAIDRLARQQAPKDWYTTAEAAQLLGKAEFTVREWCRLGLGHVRFTTTARRIAGGRPGRRVVRSSPARAPLWRRSPG